MKALHKKRLLKLAKHLRAGKLGHKKFNFAQLNSDERGCFIRENVCGYQGCAIGEMPIAFKGSGLTFHNCDLQRAQQFFNLEPQESAILFLPTSMSSDGVLPKTATRKQVAANIEAFVKRKENPCN